MRGIDCNQVQKTKKLDYDGYYEDTWEDKQNEWLPYLKNDVLSTAFCYARYTKSMEELSGFGMKNCLTLPSLANSSIVYETKTTNLCTLITTNICVIS